MLTIRPEQAQILQESLDKPYCLELRDYFRKTYANETADRDDETLLAVITASVRRARALNIETADAMLRFVGIAVLVNPTFYDDMKVKQLFAETSLDVDYKVHLLSERLIEELRASDASQSE